LDIGERTTKNIHESKKSATRVMRPFNIPLDSMTVLFRVFVSCPVFVPFHCNRRVNWSNRRINFLPQKARKQAVLAWK